MIVEDKAKQPLCVHLITIKLIARIGLRLSVLVSSHVRGPGRSACLHCRATCGLRRAATCCAGRLRRPKGARRDVCVSVAMDRQGSGALSAPSTVLQTVSWTVREVQCLFNECFFHDTMETFLPGRLGQIVQPRFSSIPLETANKIPHEPFTLKLKGFRPAGSSVAGPLP